MRIRLNKLKIVRFIRLKKKEKEGKKKKMYCFFKMPMDYAELYLWSFILSSQEEAENLRRRCQADEKA